MEVRSLNEVDELLILQTDCVGLTFWVGSKKSQLKIGGFKISKTWFLTLAYIEID